MLRVLSNRTDWTDIGDLSCLSLGYSFQEIALDLAKRLPARQKLQLIEAIVPDLAAPLAAAEEKAQPLRSLYGLWKDLGVDLSAEDIDAARRDMWGMFPREDV